MEVFSSEDPDGVEDEGPLAVGVEFSAADASGFCLETVASFWLFTSTFLAFSTPDGAGPPPPDLVSLGIINFLLAEEGDPDVDVEVTDEVVVVAADAAVVVVTTVATCDFTGVFGFGF